MWGCGGLGVVGRWLCVRVRVRSLGEEGTEGGSKSEGEGEEEEGPGEGEGEGDGVRKG